MKVLNTWVWKLVQTLVENIILMIFPLSGIEHPVRKYVRLEILRSIYFAIFES